jgi:hypothetical protein
VATAEAVPPAAAAQTSVTRRSCSSSFSGNCLGGSCDYVSGFSCDCIIRNPCIRTVSGGNLGIRDAARAASARNSQSERSKSGQKQSPQSESGPPVKRESAGHVEINDVHLEIRKIVSEDFNLPGSQLLVLFSWFRGRSGMVCPAHEWFWGRARLQPCRYWANKNAGP